MSGDPSAYAVSWAFERRGRPPFHHGEERIVYPTKAEAEAKLAELRALGGLAAGCVTPVWPKQANPLAKAAKRAALEAMGMPVQLSPKAAERQARRKKR
jgi:hypothetical protein